MCKIVYRIRCIDNIEIISNNVNINIDECNYEII